MVDKAQRLIQATVGVVPTSGNRVEVLRNGSAIFPAMLEAIAEAEQSIAMTTYVYWTGEVAQRFAYALADRARDGIEVRVLVDWIGGRIMNRDLVDVMTSAGVEFAWFRPPSRIARAAVALDEGLVGQHRTHRKVLVCDGTVGFTGGVGIAEEWTGDADGPDHWRDTHIRVEGPASVSLLSAFATNWQEATGVPVDCHSLDDAPTDGPDTVQVVRGQPGRFVSDIALTMRALLTGAEQRIWIETAYFVPEDELCDALTAAVKRGVDVNIIVPGPNIDKRVSWLAAREAYEPLLEAGVTIYEFQPTMLHCKIAIIDDIGVVGSANLNMRSMHQDDEVIAVVHGGTAVDDLVQHFAEDLTRSELMDPDRFEERSRTQKFAEGSVGVIKRFL